LCQQRTTFLPGSRSLQRFSSLLQRHNNRLATAERAPSVLDTDSQEKRYNSRPNGVPLRKEWEVGDDHADGSQVQGFNVLSFVYPNGFSDRQNMPAKICAPKSRGRATFQNKLMGWTRDHKVDSVSSLPSSLLQLQRSGWRCHQLLVTRQHNPTSHHVCHARQESLQAQG